MGDHLVKDPMFIRKCILYEFLGKKPSFETYKVLCKKLGNDFMIYPVFEIWYLRFSNGNFDLETDISLDPKYRQFTDLPLDIDMDIFKTLDTAMRLTLRHVSKSFRYAVERLDPECQNVEIRRERRRGEVSIKIGNWKISYKKQSENQYSIVSEEGGRPNLERKYEHNHQGNYENVAIDDVVSILKHPKLKLEKFELRVADRDLSFGKNLLQKMLVSIPKIYAKEVVLPYIDTRMLTRFQPGNLEKISIRENFNFSNLAEKQKELDEMITLMNGFEQCQKAEMVHFKTDLLGAFEKLQLPRFTLTCDQFNVNMLKTLLASKTAEKVVLNINRGFWLPDISQCLQELGAMRVSEDDLILRYRIPESKKNIAIEKQARKIEIEKEANSQ